MTDSAIIAASYNAEKSYTHNLDNVIDPSDAVGAWGTTKESTTELVDLSGNGNIADIHGAMPAEGFIQGRQFDGVDDKLATGTSLIDLEDVTAISLSQISTNQPSTGIFQILSGKFALKRDNGHMGLIILLDTHRTITKQFTLGKLELFTARYNKTAQTTTLGVNDSFISGDWSDDTVDTIGNGPIEIGTYFSTNFCSFNNYFTLCFKFLLSDTEIIAILNTIARLPFWSVNYTDYPDNVTEYTDNLPYSSSIISSGTFKVDDDKLQCVSAGTMTYKASYEFDGSEYIKVEIGGVEYAGTGTITQGNTTVSVAQGSNKITIQMGTGDTIDEINIQFREEV